MKEAKSRKNAIIHRCFSYLSAWQTAVWLLMATDSRKDIIIFFIKLRFKDAAKLLLFLLISKS